MERRNGCPGSRGVWWPCKTTPPAGIATARARPRSNRVVANGVPSPSGSTVEQKVVKENDVSPTTLWYRSTSVPTVALDETWTRLSTNLGILDATAGASTDELSTHARTTPFPARSFPPSYPQP